MDTLYPYLIVAMVYFPWLLLAPPGFSWFPLAPPSSSWLLLVPPWLLLAPPGTSWLTLAPPGSSWLLLAPKDNVSHTGAQPGRSQEEPHKEPGGAGWVSPRQPTCERVLQRVVSPGFYFRPLHASGGIAVVNVVGFRDVCVPVGGGGYQHNFEWFWLIF
jgi:hypothetical protein